MYREGLVRLYEEPSPWLERSFNGAGCDEWVFKVFKDASGNNAVILVLPLLPQLMAIHYNFDVFAFFHVAQDVFAFRKQMPYVRWPPAVAFSPDL